MSSDRTGPLDRLLTATTEEAVCEVGAELVSDLAGSPASIYSLAENDTLEVRSTTVPSLDAAHRSIPLSDHVLAHTARLERPARIDDCTDTRSAAAAWAADSTTRTYRSALLVPVPDWGLVIAADEAPGAFDDGDLATVELAARIVEEKLHDVATSTVPSFAEERLEKVASVLSHDLASPLTVARAYVTDAIETGKTENLEDVLLALERIEEITGGLEEYARTGQTVTEPRPVELREAAEASWSMIESGGATLETPDSETLLADEVCLYQLFENLFANAVQHGGEDVTVRVGVLDGESEREGEAGFYVEDDGPGIATENRDVVFEHGYSGTDDQSGFGLSIVNGIVDGHGWEIYVVDGTEGGARFEVTGVRLA